MKIVTIISERLYSFHYENEEKNEFERLINLWGNPIEIFSFLQQNQKDLGKLSIKQLSDLIFEDNETIITSLVENENLNDFFKPLNNNEYQSTLLSKQKGRKNYLRIYALKIDDNCFVITGGAIKLTHLMQDRPHTQQELTKIEKCKNYLSNCVNDIDSFYEFLIDENYDK